MNRLFTSLLAMLMLTAGASASDEGGITPDMLARLKATYHNSAADRALRNALGGTSIDKLAANADARPGVSARMSHRVRSRGITDQKSSGRCWLFTGLNVERRL